MEYFIVTKNIAKNGIIEYKKDLFLIIFIFCKELTKNMLLYGLKIDSLWKPNENLCAN